MEFLERDTLVSVHINSGADGEYYIHETASFSKNLRLSSPYSPKVALSNWFKILIPLRHNPSSSVQLCSVESRRKKWLGGGHVYYLEGRSALVPDTSG